ncbi:MAG TPA: hypothetical protein VFE33_32800 [Thermoanaerobaculia bacterium]|nr:hypothetical protein [Thermoanaerobaculia bacterium]
MPTRRTRRSTVSHRASGLSLETPLVIPSFSSKGFGKISQRQTEIAQLLSTASEFLTGVYLISAFDMHYGQIPAPRELSGRPELIIVDSGGYETSDDYDLSAVYRPELGFKPWTEEMLAGVLDKWPEELPAVFVSFDHHESRRPVVEQLAAARDLFKGRSHQLSCFLLKPETRDQSTLRVALGAAIARAEDMRSFDIIGVTEKELGTSPLERMKRIVKLRSALDEAQVRAPIHVFGALDPASICLYYLAGAEMFDGLTWLRYAFVRDRDRNKDHCVYIHSYSVIEEDLRLTDSKLRLRVLAQNYYYLEQLQNRLRDFHATGDFTKLPHPDFLRNACDSLEGELARGGY